jgi:hypothetical protein
MIGLIMNGVLREQLEWSDGAWKGTRGGSMYYNPVERPGQPLCFVMMMFVRLHSCRGAAA